MKGYRDSKDLKWAVFKLIRRSTIKPTS